MVSKKGDNVGRISVDVQVTNNDDLVLAKNGVIPPDRVRRATVRGLVDSGATILVVPEQLARQLGLPIDRRTKVAYADGRSAERDMATGVHLSWGGRASVFDAIVEPGRDTALIGAIVLEALDLIVDCGKQQLAPRDPEQVTAVIE